MIETKTITNQTLFEGVETAFSEIPHQMWLHNPEQCAGTDIHMLFTLCPLYGQGTLENSTLLSPPSHLTDSRVASKWNATADVVNVFKDFLERQRQKPSGYCSICQ